jgi:hypothetical protein
MRPGSQVGQMVPIFGHLMPTGMPPGLGQMPHLTGDSNESPEGHDRGQNVPGMHLGARGVMKIRTRGAGEP